MDRLKRAEQRYGRWLWLYPPGYRRRFGDEMRQTFRDLYRDQPGPTGGSFWTRVAYDLAAGAVREHVSLIRNEPDMKKYLSNYSADGRTLVWGVILLLPAAAFLATSMAMQVLGVTRPWTNQIGSPLPPLALAGLPVAAVIINLWSLAGRIGERKGRGLSWAFVRQNFWTLAVIAAGLGWLALIFGHDTVGCAVNHLPMLDWNAFQHCAATH